MNLVQIATSVDHGAYYYNTTTNDVYHVPYEELLELNNVRSMRLFSLLIFCTLFVTVIVEFAHNVHHEYSVSLPIWLLMTMTFFSSYILYRFVKRHQKRISSLIQVRHPVLLQRIDLIQEIKHGRKTYFKILAYIIFLFCTAILSLVLLKETPDILLEMFFVSFFDTGVMMMAILQPFGKILAYSKIKKGGHNHG